MKKSIKQLLSAVLVIAMMATLLVVPAAAAADSAKIDVYDFGAEQLDTAKYNNMLTEAEINSWYAADVAVGTDGKTLPTTFTTADGNLSYDANSATNHRLRTSNTNLTRYDTRSLKDADGNVYAGYVYSNSGKAPAVKMTLNKLKAGDKVVYATGSNGGDSTIQFEGPNGVEGEQLYKGGEAQVQLLTFYPKADGAYSVCSLDEKLVVARIYVEHPSTVAVTGAVTMPANMTGLKLVFTNTVTGVAAEAAVEGGKYTVNLQNYQAGASYVLSTKDATGAVIATGENLTLAVEDTTKTHDVAVEKVKTKLVSGTFTGLSADQLAKVELSMVQPAGKLLVPQIAVDRTTGVWSTELEPDVTYTVVAKKVNDSNVATSTVVYTGEEEKTDAVIAFEAKPTHAVTIVPEGITAADMSDAVVTFTLLNEGGPNEDELVVPYNAKNEYHYVYTFNGIGAIQLRDGTYDVKVETAAGKQKVTSNLKVEGTAASKTVRFTPAAAFVAPGTYDLTTGMNAGDVPRIDGVKFNGLTYHNNHGLIGQKDSTITLSLEEPADIIVTSCCYGTGATVTSSAGEVTAADGTEVNGDVHAQIYTVAGVEGDVTITFGSTVYVHNIAVESATPATVAADTYDFAALTGLAQRDPVTVKGIDFGSFVYWNSHGLNGKDAVKLNMAEKGIITITTCCYGNGGDVTVTGGTLASVDTTEDNNGTKGKTLTITDAEGEVTVNFAGTTYIHDITVEYPTFEIVPAKWNFMDGSLEAKQIQGKAEVWEYLNIDATTGKFNCRSTNWAQFNDTTKITVPIYGAVAVGDELEVVVEGYTTDYTINGTPATDKTTTYTVSVDTDHTFTVTATANSYIGSITVNYPEGTFPAPAEDIVLKVGADKEYKTINAALAAAAAVTRDSGQRITIEIDPGNYEELLTVNVKDLTLKNAKAADATLELKNKGVDIGSNEVRITWYYGHGYNYYSMTTGGTYDADVLEVNKENGYPSFANGGGNQGQTFWNSTVSVIASGFNAEGIIFENSFNQYVSAKSVEDVIVSTNSSVEPKDAPRGGLKTVGDTCVQKRAYVERAAALGIANNMGNVTFDNCAFIGRQDVVFGGTGVKAAFYDCDIYGGTDYIMGPMTAVVAKSDLVLNTSEDKNDVAHITAAQNDSNVNGYLMYNCTVKSTVPGVNTASEKLAKPSDFGRPWSGEKAEAVFYKTIVEATDPSYVTVENPSFSLIQPIGWAYGLGGSSKNCVEFGTMEWYEYEDNFDLRDERFGGVLTEEKSPVHGVALTPAAWLGADFDDFWADKDLTIKTHTPVAVTPIILEVVIDGEAAVTMAEGDTKTFAATAAVAPRKAPAAEITWSSSDTAVAKVDAKGVVTAVKAGTATLTATAGDKTATVEITVEGEEPKPEETVYTITADAKVTVTAGSKKTVNVTVDPAGEVYAVSADAKIATVSVANGKVTINGVKAGKTTVTLGVKDGLGSAEIAVTVNAKSTGGSSSGRPSSRPGATEQPTNLPFADVKADDWFYSSVKKAFDKGLMKGTSETTFDPAGTTTRAMVATVLYRLDGEKKTDVAALFEDVAADTWFTDAVAWAAEKGIVKGYDDKTFAPNDNVTREQLVVMLYRYASATVKEGRDLSAFQDAAAVSEWAVEAMTWAVDKGIILGRGNATLDPTGVATRAEVCTMLVRYLEMK